MPGSYMNCGHYELTTLNTGLRVVTHKMQHVESVAINIIVKVGSRFETEEENGICHFLEHMAFKGTETMSAKQIAEEFDLIGGHLNAYTSREFTVYYAKVLKEHAAKATEILSDILQNSVFKQEEIQKEYSVICQEIAQTEDNPDELVYDKLLENTFRNQSLGRSILGTPNSIAKFDTSKFKSYIKTKYSAQNIVVSAAGNIEHNNFVALVERLFGNLSQEHNLDFVEGIYTPGCIVINKELEQSNLVIAYKSCSYKDIPNIYYTQLLSIILGGGMSSRLFQRIREDLGLAYSVGCFTNSYEETGLLCLFLGTAHDKVYSATFTMAEEIKKICSNIEDQELQRAKSQIKSNILMSLEKNSYKSEEIGKNISIFGKSRSLQEIIDTVENIKINDLLEIANGIFSSEPSIALVGNGISQDKLIKAFTS